MADQIKSSGTFTVTINGNVASMTGDLTLAVNKTGSNAVAEVKNITSGSWQALSTSSLSDVRYMYFSNEGSGSIIVANDAAGTKVISMLRTYDHSQIAWSGSIANTPLYANISAESPGTSSVLYYILAES